MAYNPNDPQSTLNIPALFYDPNTKRVHYFDAKTGGLGTVPTKSLSGLGFGGYDVSKLPTMNEADVISRISETYGRSPAGVTDSATDQLLISNFGQYYNSAIGGQNPVTGITKTAGLPENPQGAAYSVNGTEVLRSPSLAMARAAASNYNLATGGNVDPTKARLETFDVTKPITKDTLSGGTYPAFQTPSYNPAYPVATLPTYQPPQTPQLTPMQQQAQDLSARLSGLYGQQVGRSAFQTQQNEQFGVNAAQKSLMDLSAQLQGIKNEAAAIPLQLQQGAAERGVTTSLLGAQENSRLRTNAIAALGVSTLLAATQGQLANAKMMADQAVAQRFDPIDEQIRALSANLQLIMQSPQYSAEEKAQARAQLEIQQQKAQQVAYARENFEMVQKIAIEAAQYLTNFKPTTQYPSATLALQAIQQAGNPILAQKIASTAFPETSTAKILGSASSGYFTYDPATGKTTPISGGGTGSGGTGGGYQAGQLTQLLQSQGKKADDATLQTLWTQYGTGGTYVNDTAHNSIIYSAMGGPIKAVNPNISAVTGKPLTDVERLSQGYANRAVEADSIIDRVGAQFTGAVSYLGQILPNVLKSSERQEYEQAQRNFVNAILRRESGAAIAQSEFDNAIKQYFPQPGDSKEVIAQKDRNRATVIQSLQLAGGAQVNQNDPLGIL